MLEDKSFIVLDATEETMDKMPTIDSGYIPTAEVIPEEDYSFDPSTWTIGARSVGAGVSFRPVRGLEEKILAGPARDGHLYFATDTGRIFIAEYGEYIPMGGGGIEIFYAHAEPNDIKEDASDGYYLSFNSLDDPKAAISEDDLIINVTESGTGGQFFRVKEVDKNNDKIVCSRIAVSGTGGGGGSYPGGGGDSPSGSQIKMEFIENVKFSYIYGQPDNVIIKTTSEAEDQDIIYSIQIVSNSGQSMHYQESAKNGEIFTFDIGSKLYKGLNKIVISAMGGQSQISTGNREYKQRNCVEMKLNPSKDFNPLEAKTLGQFSFSCMPVGADLVKTLRLYIDGELDDSLTQRNIRTSGQNIGVTITGLKHGAHTIKAVLSTGEGAAEISAPPLEYEIAWIDEGNDAPVIWTNNIPKEIIDHEKLTIEYKIYNPSSITKTNAQLYIDQEEIPTSPIEVGYDSGALVWEQWPITNYKLGNNIFTIRCGSVSKTFEIKVIEDELRNLNIIETDIELKFDSKGRSNKENKTSRETWVYKNKAGVETAVKFNNFNWYNNGWIIDDNGDSCLRISNGANISIPLSVMNVPNLTHALTFEFQFKLRNVQSLNTLVTTNSYEEDGKLIIEKTVDTDEGVFGSYYNNGIGLCLGTQEAFFKASGGSIVNARYTDGQMVNVSFVIQAKSQNTRLMHIYLNGILSGITSYSNGESFDSMAKELVFNSQYCDVDLYKIRVYKAELTPINVVHNYIADMASAELYDQNQIAIFEDNTPYVDYQMVVDYNTLNPDNPTMPYAVIEIAKADTSFNDEKLPFVKGGKRLVDVTFVNPSLDRAYDLFKNGEVVENMTSDNDYIEGCPSFKATNVRFDVQGTSSQGYPRRNYKGKFKQNEDNNVTWVYTHGPLKDKSLLDKIELNGKKYKYYYMDNANAAESTFTWKADYMESSGTHNTGFASFVKTLYSRHPLANYIDGYISGDHRTTIYGFPMMVFQKKHDGTYDFIGKYNFNLDKACNNVIDFKNETAHPYVVGTFDEKQEDGTVVQKPLDFAHVAECWEFKNNQHTRCSFNQVDFAETNADGNLTVLSDFEYRYLYDEDTMDAAIDADTLVFPTKKEANEYILDKMSNLEKVANWLYSTNTSLVTNELLPEPITYGSTKYTHDTRDYRLTKFKYEFSKHFNFEYCAIYFIMTELILGYDSRGKNCMFASWGPQERNGEYIWYPIFYDIDTQLGVNNSGVPTWEYDTEATRDGQFSTADSVLWNNLWECYSNEIKAWYVDLRNNALTIEKLNGFYDFDPKISKSFAMMGNRPINMVNIDEYFKYIAPAITGYIDTTGKTQRTDLYFYCLQGTRELQRELFLRNRFNYIDSQWLGGPYSTTGILGEFSIRYNANDALKTSDKYLEIIPEDSEDKYIQAEYPHALDANASFTIKPYLKQYASAIYDGTSTTPVLYNGNDSVVINPPSNLQESIKNSLQMSQQLVYIGGVEYISSFGDMSLKYVNEFKAQKAIRLQELILGNENPDYFNSVLTSANFKIDAAAKVIDDDTKKEISNPNAKTLLRKIVLTNIGTLDGDINLTSCEKLQELRALGTKISGILFADGAPIETLYLPNTITYFDIIEPIGLNTLLEEVPTANDKGEFPKGLYIKGITDLPIVTADSVTKINRIDIKSSDMKYNSYKLLDKVVKIKEAMQANNNLNPKDFNKELRINMENISWTPYRLVQAGELPITNAKYVKKTNHYTFENYAYSSATWDADTLNGKIYEYDSELFDKNANVLTDLSMLDKFINSYLGTEAENYFKSTVQYDDARKSIPYMAGNIFINNPSEKPISEFDIFGYYNKYFPDLNIFVANVDNAYVANFVEILDNGKEYEWDSIKYAKDKISYPSATEVIPTKLHYDFKGWATTPDAKPEDVITDWTKFPFASKDTYTFYAIYDRHPYKMTFHYEDGKDPYVKEVRYNDIIGIPNEIYPYKDSSQLGLREMYYFKYYTQKDSDVEVKLNEMKAVKDLELYASFEIDNVKNHVLSSDYIYIDNTGSIKIRSSEVKNILKGKITLPAEAKSIYIGTDSFQNATNITHVFFEEGSQLTRFQNYCFNGCSNLIYVEIPETVTTLGTNAFSSCKKIKYIGPPVNEIEDSRKIYIQSNLVNIDTIAFGSMGTIAELTLGESTTKPWNVIDETSVKDTAGGDTIFNAITCYKPVIGADFMNDTWISKKFVTKNGAITWPS